MHPFVEEFRMIRLRQQMRSRGKYSFKTIARYVVLSLAVLYGVIKGY